MTPLRKSHQFATGVVLAEVVADDSNQGELFMASGLRIVLLYPA
jgi:hypothetical protein